MKNGTTKVHCACKHAQQDAMHGAGMRVANATAKQDEKAGTIEVRCTVCGTTHRVGYGAVK